MAPTTTCLRCASPLPPADEDGNAVCQSCRLFHHPDLELGAADRILRSIDAETGQITRF